MRETRVKAFGPRRRGEWVIRALLAALLQAALGAPPVFAGLVETIESMTDGADVIVRGTVVDGGLIPGSRPPTDVVHLRVTETLKGPQADSLTFLADAHDFRPWDDGEFLFFLRTASRHDEHDAVSTFDWPADDAAAPPDHSCIHRIALEADGGLGGVYDGDLRRLDKAADILATVRQTIAARALSLVDIVLSSDLALPPGAADALRGETVRMPMSRQAEAFARTLSGSPKPELREQAAEILGHFRSAENVRRLTALLDDPYVGPPGTVRGCIWIEYGTGKWATGPYAVRQAAIAALSNLHAAPRDVVPLCHPRYDAKYLSRTALAAVGAGLVSVPLLLACATVVATRRLSRGVWAVCGVLLLLAATGWLRSAWRIDELAFSAGRDRYEVAALGTGVRVMCLTDAPQVFPTALTTVPQTATTAADWEPESAAAIRGASRRTRLGVTRLWGDLLYGGSMTTFHGLMLPWWMLCAACAAPPVALAVGGSARRRWRARRADGRCPRCGYDLRASPAGCPECGWGR